MTLRFDEDYYRRFYKDPSTRVYDQKRHAKLVTGIVSLIEWFGMDVTDVLDVGAGLGWWGQWFKKHRKGVGGVAPSSSGRSAASTATGRPTSRPSGSTSSSTW